VLPRSASIFGDTTPNQTRRQSTRKLEHETAAARELDGEAQEARESELTWGVVSP
jgi:hypothetical protein